MLIEWSPPPVKLWIEYPHKPIMWIKRTIPLYKKKARMEWVSSRPSLEGFWGKGAVLGVGAVVVGGSRRVRLVVG